MFRAVLGVGMLLAALIPLYLIGILPPPSDSFADNFRRLWLAVDAAYPYFLQSGVDWDAVRERYEPRVAEIGSDAAYASLVDDMLATLNDRHTGVLSPGAGRDRTYFGTARPLSDGIVIDQIGQTGWQAGLRSGDRITEVNGVAVETALETLPAWLRNGATPQHRRVVAARNILSASGLELTVTIEPVEGASRTMVLGVPADAESAVPVSSALPREPVIRGERLGCGLGYVRIPTLARPAGHDLVSEFDAALDDLLDAPGLILDLRGNGGGDSRIGERIAGRLVQSRFTYGWEVFRLPLPQRFGIQRFPYVLQPRGKTYQGAVVLLVDSSCFSSAEMLIVSLADCGRARTVGRTTAGGSGNPVSFALPHGGVARFSTGAFRRANGLLLEGAGVTPDVEVAYTVDDLRAGRDPDLAVARRLLLEARDGGANELPTGK